MIYRFIWLNFFSSHVRRINGAYIYPYPGLFLHFLENSIIEIYGDFHIGVRVTKNSRTYSRLIMQDNSRIVVNKRSEILEGCDIQILSGGTFTVDDFHSNIGLEILCGYQIRLLGDVIAGRHVRIKDYNGHHVSSDSYPSSKPVIIEKHVWLCTGSTINAGSYIETGSVISDNSNVIGRIPKQSFIQGNPAKVVENNIQFEI